MREILNIPTKLLKAYKDDKHEFDLLAASVLLKIISPNSIVKCRNAAALMNVLHCKHNVAQRILDGMRGCELFDYNEKKGVVFVRTFKTDEATEIRHGRKRFKANEDYCKKIKIADCLSEDKRTGKKIYTLRKVKLRLREALLENMMYRKQREQLDSWANAERELEDGCVTNAKKCAMTQKMLASGFGLGRSSANRYSKRMEKDGRVSKSGIVAECAIPVLNDVTLDEWKQKNPEKTIHAWHDNKHGGWSGWVYYGCMYSLNRDTTDSLINVIWNHATRIDAKKTLMKKGKGKSDEGLSYEEFMTTPDGEGFWGKQS